MDCFLDMLDNRECLALDMVERLVQNLGENEQAKEGTYDVEIGLEYYLGYLQMVGGPLEAHLKICKQESQDIFLIKEKAKHDTVDHHLKISVEESNLHLPTRKERYKSDTVAQQFEYAYLSGAFQN